MLRSFAVRNFRCFEDFELHNLARINLLVGDNDVGKTALLEAFFAHLSQANPVNLVKLKAFRRSPTVLPDVTCWQEFFSGLDDSRPIQLTSIDSTGKQRRNTFTVGADVQISLAVPSAGGGIVEVLAKRVLQSGSFRPLKVEYDAGSQEAPVSNEAVLDANMPGFTQRNQYTPDIAGHYFSTGSLPDPEGVARHLSELLVSKQEAHLIDLAKAIDERVQRLSVASPKGPTEIFVDLGYDYLVPLTSLGSGVLRAIGIACEIPFNKGGVILVDEIEDGIYYRRLGELWRAICEMAKRYDVQLVASTHSAECVGAAFDAVTPDLKDPDPLHIYRLVLGRRMPIPYERESLKTMAEFIAEVR